MAKKKPTKTPTQVVIILGSKNDKPIVEESGMLNIFDEVGVSWELSIISAHRNPETLTSYCHKKLIEGADVFIGIAGMAAALPGAIASHVRKKPVIGVPLPSKEMPDAQDALLSMVRMPSGVPVAVSGIGKSGLCNAAILTCQILALKDPNVSYSLDKYIAKHLKAPELNVLSPKKGKKRKEN